MSRRAASWKHSNGAAATVTAVAAALCEGLDQICGSPLELYPSFDFKSGVDQNLLQEHSRWLREFMVLDPRGGYISQKDMVSGLQRALCDNDKVIEFMSKRSGGVSHEDM